MLFAYGAFKFVPSEFYVSYQKHVAAAEIEVLRFFRERIYNLGYCSLTKLSAAIRTKMSLTEIKNVVVNTLTAVDRFFFFHYKNLSVFVYMPVTPTNNPHAIQKHATQRTGERMLHANQRKRWCVLSLKLITVFVILQPMQTSTTKKREKKTSIESNNIIKSVTSKTAALAKLSYNKHRAI